MKPTLGHRVSNLPKAAYRLPLLVPGFLALFAGVLAGLWKLGWFESSLLGGVAHLHGPFMVACFFGTVIALERAVALQKPWAYLAPALTGFGGIALICGIPAVISGGAILLGSILFLLASIAITRIQLAGHTLLLAIGSGALVIGNFIWLANLSLEAVLPYWIAFLVLTIVGERLELSRMRPVSKTAQRAFYIIIAAFIASAIHESYGVASAHIFFGATLTILAFWLLQYDIARFTIRQKGLVRYIAVCLLSGYVWLAFGGLAWALIDYNIAPALTYDVALHAIFLGFVIAMVFGHAPIILPAVTTLSVPYTKAFYLHLLVLELTLFLRVFADFGNYDQLRSAAGMGNALALAIFIGNTALAVRNGLKTKRS